MPRLRKRQTLPAVFEDDLEDVLARLGLRDDLLSKALSCVICGEPVGRANLAGIVLRGGSPGVICRRPSCLLTAGIENVEAGE